MIDPPTHRSGAIETNVKLRAKFCISLVISGSRGGVCAVTREVGEKCGNQASAVADPVMEDQVVIIFAISST